MVARDGRVPFREPRRQSGTDLSSKRRCKSTHTHSISQSGKPRSRSTSSKDVYMHNHADGCTVHSVCGTEQAAL